MPMRRLMPPIPAPPSPLIDAPCPLFASHGASICLTQCRPRAADRGAGDLSGQRGARHRPLGRGGAPAQRPAVGAGRAPLRPPHQPLGLLAGPQQWLRFPYVSVRFIFGSDDEVVTSGRPPSSLARLCAPTRCVDRQPSSNRRRVNQLNFGPFSAVSFARGLVPGRAGSLACVRRRRMQVHFQGF